MRRYRVVLLLVLCMVCGNGAVAGAAESGDRAGLTEDYLSARDKAVENLGKLPQEAAWKREPQALSELEKRMNSLIGPISVRSLPKAGFNLSGLAHDEGFGRLDGLLFSSEDGGTKLVVSTRPLLRSWLTAHKNWSGEGRADNLSPHFPAVLGTESFYTQAVADGSAYMIFAPLPVTAPPGAAFISATLDGQAQDVGLREPAKIVMSVLAGDRVYILMQELGVKIDALPACETIASKLLGKSDELLSRYRAGNLADQKLFDEAETLELKSDQEYRRCFAAQAPKQPAFAAAIRQAQALLAILPPA